MAATYRDVVQLDSPRRTIGLGRERIHCERVRCKRVYGKGVGRGEVSDDVVEVELRAILQNLCIEPVERYVADVDGVRQQAHQSSLYVKPREGYKRGRAISLKHSKLLRTHSSGG